MCAAYAIDCWKESPSNPGTPMNQQYTQSVPRKKLEHYSYLLTDIIGKGYSSQVFKGRNDISNESVAIKVINMAMLKSDVHQSLLASEIECLKSLVGMPNIIQLKEVYTTKNNTYLITELCEDGDLSKVIKKGKILESKAIQMIQQVIGAYLEIHRKGILHRDLKPANVFLKGQQLKIADFGFAIKAEDTKKTANYNVGSPLYMPPQSLVNNKYSYKSDIWALGVIFFEMLTGKAPWKAKNQQQLSRKICTQPIETLLPNGLSQTSKQFLTRTLQPQLSGRMGPEELQRFSFGHKYFIDLKSSVKLQSHERTKSLLKSSRNLSIPKLEIQTPKASVMASLASAQKSNRQESISNPYRIAIEPEKTDREVKKENSSYLLSEIHFCRFLYKLICRLNDTGCDFYEALKQQLSCLVAFKLSQVSSLERADSFHMEHYKEYKETTDFKKIMNITKQYEEKYEDIIGKYGYPLKDDHSAVSRQLVCTIRQLKNKLQYLTADLIAEAKDQLILLDYLVTAYQLVELSATKDIALFHSKSKIEAVVEGIPTKVTINHWLAVKEKIKKLQLA